MDLVTHILNQNILVGIDKNKYHLDYKVSRHSYNFFLVYK